jgi:hypothetical protein
MSLSVFLCHASEDKPTVRELYEKLQRDGFDPWLDEENLFPGQDWKHEISKAVRDSDVVLVCLSENSVSKTGYVQKEIKVALDVVDEQLEGAIFIIPVKLEECDVPDRLSPWQWVNLEDARGYERLVASLLSRSIELGIDITNTISTVEDIKDSLYDEDETLDANTHMFFPCELQAGEKINIDLRSDESVDVLIMDEGDYKKWNERGEVDTLYKEFLDRDQLHAFFTAPVSDTYLVIVRNNSDEVVEIELKIDHTD